MIGPDDWGLAPDDWLKEVCRTAKQDCPVPTRPAFSFGTDAESLEANGRLLESVDFDFEKLLGGQKGTTAWHGSEFRPSDQLRRIMGDHPSLPYLEEVFDNGMEYLFHTELSYEERALEVGRQVERGNHQSAQVEEETVARLLEKDVTHGFSFPFRAELVGKIPGAMVQPCGLAAQFSLNSDGSRQVKKRLTHDLTYSLSGDKWSVNDRVDMSKYPEMVYGWCLLRTIHFIVCLRHDFPETKIYIAKYDYSDAYRRISHAASAAIQSILVLAGVAYMALRLAFGGSPNPACFCAFSEALTDLANELSCSSYDPEKTSSPAASGYRQDPKNYPFPREPIAEAIAPAVEVPTSLDSRKDCFIDDIIAVFLGTERNLKREGHTVPLAVHAMSRPHAGDGVEPIQRRPLLAPDKLLAEGTPSETMVVLGWLLDTRKLLVRLPLDKFSAWERDLEEVISHGSASIEALDSLIGRLNHASFLVPLSRHFLNGLREKTSPTGWARRRTVRLSYEEIEDLKLWRKFLKTAHSGISMNLLTIRTPTLIAWSDSCPFGIGGYTLGGRAWRLKIPPESSFFGDDSVNNVLEFLGMAVSVKLLILEAEGSLYACLLPLGDNTSAISWIFRSGRITKSSPYYAAVKMIAREVANDVMAAKVQVTPQHLKGSLNDVADLLSYAGTVRGKTDPLTIDNPPNDILTDRIHSSMPQVIPESFKISPLPDEAFSFVSQVLATIEESWIRSRRLRTPRLSEPGGGGSNSSGGAVSWTRSSLEYPGTSETFSAGVFSPSIEKAPTTGRGTLLADVRNRWWLRLSETPSAIWLRRFGQATGRAPSTGKTSPSVAGLSERK
jgi:hypothetical protein